MALNKGTKIAVGMFVLAGVAMIIGIVSLIAQSGSGKAPKRKDVDLEKIAELFKSVKGPSDLKAFEEELNKKSDEVLASEDLLDGAHVKDGKETGIQVKLLEDGSVLGFIDRETGLDKAKGQRMIEITDTMAVPVEPKIPAGSSPDPAVKSTLKDLAKMSKRYSDKPDEAPPLSSEVLFFIRPGKDKDGKNAVVYSDRHHGAYPEKSKEFMGEPLDQRVSQHRRYYGGHSYFFIWYSPGYYRNYSSRRRSLGGRFGSGGIGGGK